MLNKDHISQNIPQIEEEVLAFWKENRIFEKSIEQRKDAEAWTFLDGPPFVTGMPHYGSLLSSLPKDLYPRFWTMKGYNVRRVWGWDGHGLPIENKVEGKLEVKRKKDIENVVGIKTFIDECKTYVNQVSDEWEWYVDKVGRWVDFKNAYKTWDIPYMETVMWVFKQMYEKDLIYKGLRVSLYCPHCSTPISNFEVAMDADNYKEITEAANTYKYKVQGQDKTFFLAWSTTPWNKIVTPALAVNPELSYVKVKEGDEFYILAETTLKMLKTEEYEVVEKHLGKDLVGMKFEPHYDYFKIDEGKKAWEIIGGEFVTADEGTGIVTIAAYGEEDLAVMKRDNVHIEMHVDEEGHILPEVPKFGGMYYLKANKVVNQDLEERGLMYKEENYTHKVATCWRCHTRLFYAPQNAWYVNIQDMKEEMKQTNEDVNWYPHHFKHGRFLKSMEAAPDWCISRNRYWGSPVPVWECKCGTRFVPGSIAELEEKSGQTVKDLHRPEIDEIVVTCEKCGEKAHRVPEVLDSWIEAGSASFAERHFPFNTEAKLEDFFPPDFIVEYTGQIRAWFYVLHVISNALYKSKAFKNVGVTGVILGTDGRKMSKNFGNYPDPKELLQKYGGDALRLYLLGSPVMNGEDIIISEDDYKSHVRAYLLTLLNIYNFYSTYAKVDGWKGQNLDVKSTNVLDLWIQSLTARLVLEVTKDFEKYDSPAASAKLNAFLDDFSKWYVRRSRDRAGLSAENQVDKEAFYSTMYHTLTTFLKISAPLTPFITEYLYKDLTDEESVHLTNWPDIKTYSVDDKIIEDMKNVRALVEVAHRVRKELKVKVRQPLASVTITAPTTMQFSSEENENQFKELLQDELNVKSVIFNFEKREDVVVEYDSVLTPELQLEGELREVIRTIQQERKVRGLTHNDKVHVIIPQKFDGFVEQLKKATQTETVEFGDDVKVL